MPAFCNQEHLCTLDRLLDVVGPDRAVWIEQLIKHFPDLTASQADDIVYYYLTAYMDAQAASCANTWSHRYLAGRIALRGF